VATPKRALLVESSKPKSSKTSLIGAAGPARLDISIAGRRELSLVLDFGKSRLDCSSFFSPNGKISSFGSFSAAAYL